MALTTARMSWNQAKVVYSPKGHGELGKWSAYTSPTYTDPSSISIVLSGRCDSLMATGNRRHRHTVGAEHIMICGPEPVAWLAGEGSTEFIEISAMEGFRQSLAKELGVANRAGLEEEWGIQDPVLWIIASRFRAAAQSGIALQDVERDTLLRLLYARVFEQRFEGRLPARGTGRLDKTRLARVLDFVEASLETEIDVAALAEAAALSSYHFLRAFRLAVGVTPHVYVRARRLEHAESLLLSGVSTRTAAKRVGYASLSHFRASYRAHFGRACSPSPS